MCRAGPGNGTTNYRLYSLEWFHHGGMSNLYVATTILWRVQRPNQHLVLIGRAERQSIDQFQIAITKVSLRFMPIRQSAQKLHAFHNRKHPRTAVYTKLDLETEYVELRPI